MRIVEDALAQGDRRARGVDLTITDSTSRGRPTRGGPTSLMLFLNTSVHRH